MVGELKSGAPQLALNLSLDGDARFENFYVPSGSPLALTQQSLVDQTSEFGEHFIYLWGNAGVGKSHLLQSACHYAAAKSLSCIYLSLQELLDYPPTLVLEQLHGIDLVCLDDIEQVVGHSEWERALFIAFNDLRDSGRRLLVSANCSPSQLGLSLKDLESRFNSGLTCHLSDLSDAEKHLALKERSTALGLPLGDEACRYLLTRAPRDTGALFDMLATLDAESLAAQRKVTIPFIKQVMGW